MIEVSFKLSENLLRDGKHHSCCSRVVEPHGQETSDHHKTEDDPVGVWMVVGRLDDGRIGCFMRKLARRGCIDE